MILYYHFVSPSLGMSISEVPLHLERRKDMIQYSIEYRKQGLFQTLMEKVYTVVSLPSQRFFDVCICACWDSVLIKLRIWERFSST